MTTKTHLRGAAIALAVAVFSAGTVSALASDGDSDRIEDDRDNCVGSANPFQFDLDSDGRGDVCTQPVPASDDFGGSSGPDLMFGSYRDSVLSGGPGGDGLYGGPGDDILAGGPGADVLVGGPGDDVLSGGPGCDTFGIDTAIEHRDIIKDFTPAIDRLRFPPAAREAALDRLPRVERGGSRHVELTFIIEGQPDAVVVLEGIRPDLPLVVSTRPCGEGPPPPSICPKPGAFRETMFIGFVDMFCPDDGELRLNTGLYRTERFSVAAKKKLGEKEAADRTGS